MKEGDHRFHCVTCVCPCQPSNRNSSTATIYLSFMMIEVARVLMQSQTSQCVVTSLNLRLVALDNEPSVAFSSRQQAKQ